MDIAHDRAGYYLCWGCLNWVPAIYTSPALALVTPAKPLGTPLAAAILLAGAASVLINYDSDRQRQVGQLPAADVVNCVAAQPSSPAGRMRFSRAVPDQGVWLAAWLDEQGKFARQATAS